MNTGRPAERRGLRGSQLGGTRTVVIALLAAVVLGAGTFQVLRDPSEPAMGVADATTEPMPGGMSRASMEMGGAVPAGRTLYVTHCLACHGETGVGDGPLAATLPTRAANIQEHMGHHTEAELIRLIQDGIPPAMPPSPITEAEVRQIVEYVWTLVPDSLVAGLREMQRMSEAGVPPDSMRMPGMSMP